MLSVEPLPPDLFSGLSRSQTCLCRSEGGAQRPKPAIRQPAAMSQSGLVVLGHGASGSVVQAFIDLTGLSLRHLEFATSQAQIQSPTLFRAALAVPPSAAALSHELLSSISKALEPGAPLYVAAVQARCASSAIECTPFCLGLYITCLCPCACRRTHSFRKPCFSAVSWPRVLS